jgi:hypothetical protein
MTARLKSLLVLLVSAAACLATGPVYATCSNPNANEADLIYNGAYHTYQFCNGSQWIAEGAAGGSGGMTLISTQTAINGTTTSLQFTNLPTYNTLFLNCTGLVASVTSADFIYQVGEGGSPTWETTAHYSGFYLTKEGDGSASSYTATDLVDGNGAGIGLSGSASYPQTMMMYIPTASGSNYHMVEYRGSGYQVSTSGFANWSGGAYWANDTNAMTALQVTTSGHAGATIDSGQCNLYGWN